MSVDVVCVCAGVVFVSAVKGALHNVAACPQCAASLAGSLASGD